MARILFLVDHKHRDLPGLALIGYHLKKANHDVRFRALWEEEPLFSEFNPEVLILPKANFDNISLQKWKDQGRKLIVVDTEGNIQAKDYKLKIPVKPHVYFFWNQHTLDIHRDILEPFGTALKLVGSPRLDFYNTKYSGIYSSRQEVLSELKLLDSQKIITIATACQEAHKSDKEIQSQAKKRGQVLEKSLDYLEYVENMKDLFEFTKKMVVYILDKYEDISIVIKPHPNESIIRWNEFISSLNSNRVKLFVGKTVDFLLKISDLAISHNACNTSFEAMLFNVPSVQVHTHRTVGFFEEDHLNVGDGSIREVKDIDLFINRFLYHNYERSSDTDAFLEKYIEKYFYKFDGNRAKEYAHDINNYIKENPVRIRHSLKDRIKKIFTKPTVSIEPEPVDKNPTLIDPKGRYDNRMKIGDEQDWYDRFKALKI